MADSRFKRCLWLIDTIKRHGPISFEDLSRRWEDASINDSGEALSKKTFHNHCEAANEMFGINIVCERRGGYLYRVEMDSNKDRWTADFFNSIFLQNVMASDPELRTRIVDYDVTFSDTPFLGVIFDAITDRRPIRFHLWQNRESLRKDPEASARVGALGSKYLEDVHRDFQDYYPMYLIRAENTWFVVGFFSSLPKMEIATYKLIEMQEAQIQEDAPKLDKPGKFDIEDYISECMYGDVLGKYKTQSWDESSTTLGASIRGVIIVENLKRS